MHKQIFVIRNSTPTTLELFKRFKGLAVVEEPLSETLVQSTFSLNKSIVVSEENVSNYLYFEFSYLINIVDDEFNFANNKLSIRKSNLVKDFQIIAELLKFDIGDYKTEENFKQSTNTKKCIFCNLNNLLSPEGRLCLYKTEHLKVFVTLGAFVPGYLLIVPDEHITSFGSLNKSEKEELELTITNVKFLLEKIYKKNVIVWENGSGLNGKGKPTSSIVHAHIHICPSNVSALKNFSQSGLVLQKLKLSELDSFKSEPYLLISENNVDWHILYNVEEKIYIPRQYVRQLICETGAWNWRFVPCEENMIKTDKDFAEFITKNYNLLPESIQKATKHLLYSN